MSLYCECGSSSGQHERKIYSFKVDTFGNFLCQKAGAGFLKMTWLFWCQSAFWKWLGFLKWWCYRVRPRIITVIIFPPTFFVNSCSTLYSLSNVTFIVSWEHVLFELQLFDFFMEKWARKGMWPQIITVITFPPVFLFEFVFALHCICSLILPLLCHASRHSWSYG